MAWARRGLVASNTDAPNSGGATALVAVNSAGV
jgi:hypothetical protein